MPDIETLVVGAGVVGLAIARELAITGHSVMIVDRAMRIGSETSSRNSEVIHAGLYYPPGSLKERLCTDGRGRMYRYCAARGVPHARLGKLIFAAEQDQLHHLDKIEAAGRAAHVEDLKRLSPAQVRALEPELRCAEALLSPATGIVDSHALMEAYLGDAENAGAQLVLNTHVTRLERTGEGWSVWVVGEDRPVLTAANVINCAGLHAHRLAMATDGLEPAHLPAVRFARGVYFTYSGRHPFSRLIYPVPQDGGLGIHLTLDLAGQARFGPDVEWIEEIDYGVDAGRHAAFLQAAGRIWPGIDGDRLIPGYAGIRAKLCGPGEPAADFRVDGPERHGLAGLVNLFGIESPGLTASMAIANLVREKLGA